MGALPIFDLPQHIDLEDLKFERPHNEIFSYTKILTWTMSNINKQQQNLQIVFYKTTMRTKTQITISKCTFI
jgi:hypothetical protein